MILTDGAARLEARSRRSPGVATVTFTHSGRRIGAGAILITPTGKLLGASRVASRSGRATDGTGGSSGSVLQERSVILTDGAARLEARSRRSPGVATVTFTHSGRRIGAGAILITPTGKLLGASRVASRSGRATDGTGGSSGSVLQERFVILTDGAARICIQQVGGAPGWQPSSTP